LIERKGVEYLIDAMPLINKQIPTKLTIVGNGNLLAPLRKRVVDQGQQDTIVFRVDVPEEDLITAYEQCEVFVLPAIVDSRGDTEGLGVVLIEALSFFRPVVASKVGGIVDVIIDRQTGLLTPQKDSESLASAILELLTNRTLAEDLAARGLKHVKSIFDWDRIMDRTEAIYRSALVKPSDRHVKESIEVKEQNG
jgi:glycosyltransferase involved in cell wall biosynthesis